MLFKRVDLVYERFNARVGTSELNRFFERLIDAHPPPMTGRRRPKLYYITQALSRPPTFVVFANTTDIADSYLQYIENRLREHFDFPGVPIRLKLRDRGPRE
jgi:GTP-binding protein